MGVVIDKALGRELIHEHPIEVRASNPSSAKEGKLIINSTDNYLKVYYGGQWQDVTSLTPASYSYYQLEANTDLWLLEDGTGNWAIE